MVNVPIGRNLPLAVDLNVFVRSWNDAAVHRRGTLLAAMALALVVAGCRSTTTTSGSGPTLAVTDHACVIPGSPGPVIDWSRLRNPILSYPDAAVKDQALLWAGGQWHMLFSYVTNDTPVPGQEHWGIATAESADLLHWSAPAPWTDQPGGMASPDVVRAPTGTFVATYDSPPGESGTVQAKLFYRTSTDLVAWSAPQPLAPDLHPAPTERMIDPALAWTGNGLILAYKMGTTSQTQAFEIAWSKSGSLAGPWVVIGQPSIRVYGDTFENYELVSVNGRWRLVATSNSFDQPWMYSLSGDPKTPTSWLHWVDGRQLHLAAEVWNTGSGTSSVNYEHANSAYLCENLADGYDYLTYAGSSELTRFGGWGHAKIGVARSRDLVHWTVPPG
jgi:hypothetical protein